MSGDNEQEQPPQFDDNISIGGRLFCFVRYPFITSLNEHYVMKMMRQTGLDAVLPEEGEENVEYLVRMQSAIIDTLRAHELLAGYLLPVGKVEQDWTLAMARDTATFLQSVTHPDDKAEIQRLTLAMVFDFFKEGLASYNRSLNSLGQNDQAGPARQNQTIGAH